MASKAALPPPVSSRAITSASGPSGVGEGAGGIGGTMVEVGRATVGAAVAVLAGCVADAVRSEPEQALTARIAARQTPALMRSASVFTGGDYNLSGWRDTETLA
jgi:hypothetical protein